MSLPWCLFIVSFLGMSIFYFRLQVEKFIKYVKETKNENSKESDYIKTLRKADKRITGQIILNSLDKVENKNDK